MSKRYFYCAYNLNTDTLAVTVNGITRREVKVKLCEGNHRSWKHLKKKGWRVVSIRMKGDCGG